MSSSGPKGNRPRVAVMGELDCIMCDSHPDAAEGGMVHACGHNVQLANMYGAAIGILTSGVMEHLGGAADFIAIPAEECVDYEYRNRLMSQEPSTIWEESRSLCTAVAWTIRIWFFSAI